MLLLFHQTCRKCACAYREDSPWAAVVFCSSFE